MQDQKTGAFQEKQFNKNKFKFAKEIVIAIRMIDIWELVVCIWVYFEKHKIYSDHNCQS